MLLLVIIIIRAKLNSSCLHNSWLGCEHHHRKRKTFQAEFQMWSWSSLRNFFSRKKRPPGKKGRKFLGEKRRRWRRSGDGEGEENEAFCQPSTFFPFQSFHSLESSSRLLDIFFSWFFFS